MGDDTGNDSDDMFPGLVIETGMFRLNAAWLVVDRPDVRIWEIDCASKYPYVPVRIGNRFMVMAREDSLHLDEEATTQTQIQVLGDWTDFIWDACRYTIRICAWREPQQELQESTTPR